MDLLHLSDLNEQLIENLFQIGDQINKYYTEVLKNRNFLLFFPQGGIRTRLTFELGLKQLGANTVVLPNTALDSREEMVDKGEYLNNWADGIVVRHPDHEKIVNLAQATSVPVINAMSSMNHPCEILSDLYAIRQRKKNYRSLKYVFVGPPGNISRSWQSIARVLGLSFIQVCPQEFRKENLPEVTSRMTEGLRNADIILTDSLPDRWKTEEYYQKYQITLEKLENASPNALVCPCPPFFRGEEIEKAVIDSPFFAGYSFKKDLLKMHKAIVLFCLGFRSYDF